MSKNDKIEFLFDLYVRNWQSFTSKTKQVFVCPLCLDEFTKSEMLDNKVSEEHIIPSSLGGNFTTLTCKKCNNEDGSELDAHVIQRIRVEQGIIPINSRVTVGEDGLPGQHSILAGTRNAGLKEMLDNDIIVDPQ